MITLGVLAAIAVAAYYFREQIPGAVAAAVAKVKALFSKAAPPAPPAA